jgi:hypothetical protein
MKTYESTLVALLLSATVVMPCAAQQAPAKAQAAPSEICAACLAYLEFPPSLEPESNAIPGLSIETSTSLPAESETSGRLGEQTASLPVTPEQ